MTAALDFKGIDVSYGRSPIVHDVSIGIHPGGWLGVLGPNGAGKSTLLRTVAGAAVVGVGSPDAVLTEDLLGTVFESSIRVIDVDGSTVIVSLRTEESSS
ncbi:MAG: hypothetical protein BMS9Abin12_0824 [Acidimicrobiia bacterium]|nr:MAG: hypothetical protein BMS9Abin12_0824 [Acidimicrobiia bacterium]